MAIAAMREPSALGLLEKVALNPQPLPLPVTPEHVEPFDVEDAVQGTIVALDAIDGIEVLADDGQIAGGGSSFGGRFAVVDRSVRGPAPAA